MQFANCTRFRVAKTYNRIKFFLYSMLEAVFSKYKCIIYRLIDKDGKLQLKKKEKPNHIWQNLIALLHYSHYSALKKQVLIDKQIIKLTIRIIKSK